MLKYAAGTAKFDIFVSRKNPQPDEKDHDLHESGRPGPLSLPTTNDSPSFSEPFVYISIEVSSGNSAAQLKASFPNEVIKRVFSPPVEEQPRGGKFARSIKSNVQAMIKEAQFIGQPSSAYISSASKVKQLFLQRKIMPNPFREMN